ncbi:hypothetical protein PC119_g11450 [Phytophthora cactorum]|uniref:Tc1-like transposase DDE domain-containing protein n=1 Tax=Phytophthora cactorum TaxID=29920 RepID=A0A8T1D8J2_9STRA|nr:hypothetical protein PC114_g11809 [Phytophthora cactorum]KAG2937714.1 hypothetical protein PC117_g11574 [Phytophthora cactorum]KAG3016133.1 hypothetical protein PC119_g11450 [Phytophthora cactorum]
MGRGPTLTDAERRRIQGLGEAGFSIRAIAKRLRRSRDCVQRALKPQRCRRKGGRRSSLSKRHTRFLLRKASTGDFSAAKLKEELSCPCSTRSIRRLLARVDWLDYSKMDNTLPLTKEHKLACLEWAKRMVVRPDAWEQIIFSDEKILTWMGLMDSATIGGMCTAPRGKRSKLTVLEGRQASEHYIHTVSEYMLPFAHLHYGLDYIYQQDNASIHRSHLTKEFFEEEGITVLNWPARSPDLNPIENVWSMMARYVYANGRQYDNVASLTAAILESWEAIELSYLNKLVASMPRRCIEVIEKKGCKPHY